MLQEVHPLVPVCAMGYIKPNSSVNHTELPYDCHDSTDKVLETLLCLYHAVHTGDRGTWATWV